MTQEEKLALAENFRDTVATINTMATTMSENNIKCVTEIFSAGSTFNLDFGAADYPSTMNVVQIVGCDPL